MKKFAFEMRRVCGKLVEINELKIEAANCEV